MSNEIPVSELPAQLYFRDSEGQFHQLSTQPRSNRNLVSKATSLPKRQYDPHSKTVTIKRRRFVSFARTKSRNSSSDQSGSPSSLDELPKAKKHPTVSLVCKRPPRSSSSPPPKSSKRQKSQGEHSKHCKYQIYCTKNNHR